jgi:hypothetical protein
MSKYIVLPVFTLLFFVVPLTVAAQSPEPLLGTWKVNVAKSNYSPGPPPTFRSSVSIWESLGSGQFKNVNDSVDAKGQPFGHTEIIFRFDGADYPYKGTAEPSTRAYKRIDGRTYEFVSKVNGKVTTITRAVIATDGKTRTLTTTGTDAQGQSVKTVVLWEKQ